MKILVACEFSGVVRDAFIRRGHDAVSCDIIDTDAPGPHIKDDVLNHLNKEWDLIIAHPPCTYLCNSGVRWLFEGGRGSVKDEIRWKNMTLASQFFLEILRANCEKIAIENPVMHSHAQSIINSKYSQTVQPWQFGHGETKRTCLWLKNLPKLFPTNVVSGRAPRIHHMSPSKNRGKERSITYVGLAEAMSSQWG